MNFKRHLLSRWLTLVVLLLASAAAAQAVTLQFRTLGMIPQKGLNYSSQGKDVPIEVLYGMISLPYDYDGPPLLSLYRLVTDGDGQVTHEVVATVDLTNAGKTPLLIFSGAEKNPSAVQLQALADDATAFPKGAFRFINATGQVVNGSLKDLTFEVEPGSVELETLSDTPTATSIYARFLTTKAGRKIPVYGNCWPYNPDARTIVFFCESEGLFNAFMILDEIPTPASPTPS